MPRCPGCGEEQNDAPAGWSRNWWCSPCLRRKVHDARGQHDNCSLDAEADEASQPHIVTTAASTDDLRPLLDASIAAAHQAQEVCSK